MRKYNHVQQDLNLPLSFFVRVSYSIFLSLDMRTRFALKEIDLFNNLKRKYSKTFLNTYICYVYQLQATESPQKGDNYKRRPNALIDQSDLYSHVFSKFEENEVYLINILIYL